MPEEDGIKVDETTRATIMKSTDDELQTIPGVGKRTADDLRLIGIRRVQDLRNKDPEKLYAKLCRRVGKPVDRCMLYVLRCSVYYATRKNPDPEKLKWWSWKDR